MLRAAVIIYVGVVNLFLQGLGYQYAITAISSCAGKEEGIEQIVKVIFNGWMACILLLVYGV